jgi:uncharacterized protein (TIGR02265 family)
VDRRALEFVAPHCDIRERLRSAPGSALVRGVLFSSISSALEEAGKLDEYEARFGPHHQYQSVTFYPLADYMARLASAGALLRSPRELSLGVQDISRRNAKVFAASLLGKALIEQLADEPLRLLEQGLAIRRQTCNYGRWELVRHGPRELEVRYFDEYVWIEDALTAAAIGTFDACSIKPQVVTTLRDPYNGSTSFCW